MLQVSSRVPVLWLRSRMSKHARILIREGNPELFLMRYSRVLFFCVRNAAAKGWDIGRSQQQRLLQVSSRVPVLWMRSRMSKPAMLLIRDGKPRAIPDALLTHPVVRREQCRGKVSGLCRIPATMQAAHLTHVQTR
eukprot:gene16551-biopygen6769